MSLKDRFKEIRLSLKTADGRKMSQGAFADALGISRQIVAFYETGMRVPSNAVIKLICEKFCVSEVWLLTGEGEMFAPKTKAEQVADIAASVWHESNPAKMQLIKLVSQMDDEQLKLLKGIALGLAEALKDEE